LYKAIDETQRQPTVLIVARLVKLKNHAWLMRAFAKLPAEFDSWRLAIVGDGPLRAELGELAEQLGIAARTDWYGFVVEPFDFYERASIFALLSDYEGQSNSLLEAMSVGLPPVVSNTPALVEMVENGACGVVVPLHDVAALTQALMRLMVDTSLRARLGNLARIHAQSHDVEVVLPQWDALLARAISADPGQG
jgi:glycosyltransferase involved in cell wall biosynthesis